MGKPFIDFNDTSNRRLWPDQCVGKTVAAEINDQYQFGLSFTDGTYLFVSGGNNEGDLDYHEGVMQLEQAVALGLVTQADYDAQVKAKEGTDLGHERRLYEALKKKFEKGG